jgi:hypothetical protein
MTPRRKTDSGNWGGKRKPVGGRPKMKGRVQLGVHVQPKHIQVLEAWMRQYGAKNRSQAMREILERVAKFLGLHIEE